jgi:hypothetical protein
MKLHLISNERLDSLFTTQICEVLQPTSSFIIADFLDWTMGIVKDTTAIIMTTTITCMRTTTTTTTTTQETSLYH